MKNKIAIKILERYRINYKSSPNGKVVRVDNFLFYPTKNMFQHIKTKKENYGIFRLIKIIKENYYG